MSTDPWNQTQTRAKTQQKPAADRSILAQAKKGHIFSPEEWASLTSNDKTLVMRIQRKSKRMAKRKQAKSERQKQKGTETAVPSSQPKSKSKSKSGPADTTQPGQAKRADPTSDKSATAQPTSHTESEAQARPHQKRKLSHKSHEQDAGPELASARGAQSTGNAGKKDKKPKTERRKPPSTAPVPT